MVHRLLGLLCAPLLTLPLVAPALADADALIERGVALRQRGEDAEALELFLAAYEEEPSARAAAQVGLACQALGRWVDAERYLAEGLAGSRDPWIRKHQKPLSQALERIRDQLGDLQVVGSPPGAEVRFGGRVVGTLPMPQSVRVVAQRALLEVSAAGHAPVSREVTVAPRGRALEHVTLSAGGAPLDDFDRARLAALRADDPDPTVDAHALAQVRALRAPVRPLFGLTLGMMVPGSSLSSVDYDATGGYEPDSTSVFDDELPGPHLGIDAGVRASLDDDLDLTAVLSVGWLGGQGDDYGGAEVDVTAVTVEVHVAFQLRPVSAISPWYLLGDVILGVAHISGTARVGHSTGTAELDYVNHDVNDTSGIVGVGVGTGFVLGSREQWDLALLVPLRFTVGGDDGGFGDAISVGLALRALYAF